MDATVLVVGSKYTPPNDYLVSMSEGSAAELSASDRGELVKLHQTICENLLIGL